VEQSREGKVNEDLGIRGIKGAREEGDFGHTKESR
jgi:hypothetical protein